MLKGVANPHASPPPRGYEAEVGDFYAGKVVIVQSQETGDLVDICIYESGDHHASYMLSPSEARTLATYLIEAAANADLY